MATATQTSLGEVKLGGDIAGVNDANAPELIPSGVTAGTYTLPNLVIDTKGRITSATNGSTADIINAVPLATSTTPGIVKPANVNNITATNGIIDTGPDIAHLSIKQTFTKAQAVALVDKGAVTGAVPLDFSQGNVFRLALSGAAALGTPTNVIPGGTYILILEQTNGLGGVSFPSVFKWKGTAPNMSTTTGYRDVLSLVAVSSTVILAELVKGFA